MRQAQLHSNQSMLVVVMELVLAMVLAMPMVAVMMVAPGGMRCPVVGCMLVACCTPGGVLHAWWCACTGDAPEGVKASW